MNKGGCMACHTKDKKVVGPAFKEIAAKYKGQAGAPATLVEKVRKGGSGIFGPSNYGFGGTFYGGSPYSYGGGNPYGIPGMQGFAPGSNVAGFGTVNAELFGEDATRCAVMAYDYTVLAGTQGFQNHRKKDRLFELAERQRQVELAEARGEIHVGAKMPDHNAR